MRQINRGKSNMYENAIVVNTVSYVRFTFEKMMNGSE